MCRHQQADGKVVGCLNGGICVGKDNCVCDHIESSLWLQHQGVDREMTGWGGSDCSMPICVQGYYDPECTDNLFSIGGQVSHLTAHSLLYTDNRSFDKIRFIFQSTGVSSLSQWGTMCGTRCLSMC